MDILDCRLCRWFADNRSRLPRGLRPGSCSGWPDMTVGPCHHFDELPEDSRGGRYGNLPESVSIKRRRY